MFQTEELLEGTDGRGFAWEDSEKLATQERSRKEA